MTSLHLVRQWLIALSLLTFAACSPSDREPLRLGNVLWPGYEPLYLARERGTLSPDRVRLVEYPSATEVMRALRNGSLEAAALTLDEALVIAQQVPLKVILVMDISNGADVILARPEITSMAELRDRKVGVESTALGAFMLTRALQMHGMAPRDVIVQHVDVNAHERTFREGDLSAIVTFDPARSRLLADGANTLFSSADIPGEVVDVLVVPVPVYEERKADLEQLLDVWFDTLDYMTEAPQEAARVMAQRLKLDTSTVLDSYSHLELPEREANRRLLGGDRPALTATARRLNQILLDADRLSRPVSVDELVTDALIR